MFGRFFLFIREARFCAAPFLICGSQLYIAEVRVAARFGNRVVTGGKTVNYYKSVIVGIFVYRSVYFKLTARRSYLYNHFVCCGGGKGYACA